MVKGKRPSFDELAKWAMDYWGLTLTRSDKANRGYWSGCWRTGYTLSGNFPGDRYGHRRFATLKQLANVLQFELKEQPNAH
jgi:hypothetical protein